jgi:hypothetical protein
MANTKNKNKTLLLIKKAVKVRTNAKSNIAENVTEETVGLPGLIQPTEYDLHDELVRMDSFSYRQYNE